MLYLKNRWQLLSGDFSEDLKKREIASSCISLFFEAYPKKLFDVFFGMVR